MEEYDINKSQHIFFPIRVSVQKMWTHQCATAQESVGEWLRMSKTVFDIKFYGKY